LRARDEVDDAILVQAAQRGDVAAFEEIVRRHQAAVYRVGLRMLGSRADAEDVTQETFVRAWRGLGRFHAQNALSTWLYRIVTRRCLDTIAARRTTDQLEEASVDPTARDPAAVVEQQARMEAVVRAVSDLPADQRAALVLREFEGLSYAELSEVLDITIASVKGRLHRARLTILRTIGS
jgi:RNA polymerase sigma-70 factor (ECF subfamily)